MKMMGLQFTVQYKKGIHNGAADALCRKPLESSQIYAVSTVQPRWLATIQASYTSDEQAQRLLQKLALQPDADAGYTLDHGIIRHKGRIWVGDGATLQRQIVSAFHDSPHGGHS